MLPGVIITGLAGAASLPESRVVFLGARLLHVLELFFRDALDLEESLVGCMHDGLDGKVIGFLIVHNSQNFGISVAWMR